MADEREGQVFDIAKGDWKPAEPKQEEAAASATTTTTEEKKEEEKPADTTAATTTKTEEKPVDTGAADFSSTLAQKYKDYGIESEEDMKMFLDSQEELVNLLEEAKKNPQFENEADKKAFEFIKQYPPSLHGEGLKTYVNLINMDDIDKVDGKSVMKEAFILSKPNLTRDKAEKLFESDYKRFTLDKEKYEDEKDYKDAQELSDIRREEEEDKARELLKTKKEQLKAKQPEKKTEQEAPKVPEESLRQYSTDVDKYFKDFKGFEFKSDENQKDPLFTIKPTEAQVKIIKDAVASHVKRADVYDKSGKIPNFDAADLAQQMAYLLFDKNGEVNPKGERWLTSQVTKQIKTLAETLKIEQIAQRQPDKKTVAAGKEGKLSIEEQFAEHGRREQAERAAKGIRQIQ